MDRPKLGAVRLRALRILYENTEDGRIYGWSKLVELLVKNGINEGYARQIIWDFNILGILEKPRTGLYKVNKARLKEYLDKYEATLKAYADLHGSTVEALRARGGSG